ncbi:YbaN family protein [Corallincola platygyrae]|uniref:Inner membrane protein n=1 Tax=Corallincola platygyrae TaxID=1193278 RepID=A0ABW4XIY8_9GAMM
MKREHGYIKRLFLTWAALLCVLLGLIGAVLPVLPTTPFLILATVLSFNASPSLRRWLLKHPLFGQTIRNYLRHRAISAKALRAALITLWCCIALSIWLTQIVWLAAMLLVIATSVSWYLLSLQRV